MLLCCSWVLTKARTMGFEHPPKVGYVIVYYLAREMLRWTRRKPRPQRLTKQLYWRSQKCGFDATYAPAFPLTKWSSGLWRAKSPSQPHRSLWAFNYQWENNLPDGIWKSKSITTTWIQTQITLQLVVEAWLILRCCENRTCQSYEELQAPQDELFDYKSIDMQKSRNRSTRSMFSDNLICISWRHFLWALESWRYRGAAKCKSAAPMATKTHKLHVRYINSRAC